MADDPVDSAVTLQNPDLVPQYLIEVNVYSHVALTYHWYRAQPLRPTLS